MLKGFPLIFLKIVTTSFLVSIVFLLIFFLPKSTLYSTDLVSFLTGARIISSGNGQRLYDISYQYDIQKHITENRFEGRMLLPYLYFPLNAFLFIPFLSFSLEVGYRIFVCLILCGFGLLALKFKRLFKIKDFFQILLLFVLYLPNFASIFAPQFSVIIIFIFLYLYLSFKNNEALKSGIFSSLLFIKPTFLIAIPFLFLLSKEKRKFVTTFLISAGVLGVLNIYLGGLQILVSYPSFLSFTDRPEFGNRPEYSFGILSFLKSFDVLSELQFITVWGILYGSALHFFNKILAKIKLEQSFSLILFLTTLLSLHLLLHDMSVLILIPFLISVRIFSFKSLVLSFIFFFSPLFMVWGLSWITTASYLFLFMVFTYSLRDVTKSIFTK